jgi:hypothetical protein
MKTPLLLLATCLIASTLFAGERTFHIEDPFGTDHGQQAVRFEETFSQPGVPLSSLGATVDGKPAFFQRRAIENFSDGSVKKGEWILWLHLASPNKKGEAPDGSSAKFDVKLTWGGPVVQPAAFSDTPVKVSKDGDYLLINTGVAAFRVPDNKVVSGPKGPQGPIAGFRQAADPKWYGGNAAIEGARISAVKTEVLSNGPARAVVAVTFTNDEDLTWRSELTFTAGSPVVQIDDTMEFPGVWSIDLTEDMAPDTQFACPWFDWESGNQRGTPSEKPLRAWKAGDVRGGEWPDLNEFFRLDPKWHDYQYMKGPYAWYYNKADRANRQTAFAMFAWNMTKWHPTYQSRPRAVVTGDKKGALRILVPITGGAHTRTLPADDPADPLPRVVRTNTAGRSWGIAAFPTPDIKAPSTFTAQATEEAKGEIGKTIKEQVSSEKKNLGKKAEQELKTANSGNKDFKMTPEALEAKLHEMGWPAKSDEVIAKDRLAKKPEPSAEDIRRRADKLSNATSAPVRDASVQTLVRNAHLPVTKIKDWTLTWPDMDKNVDKGIFRGLDDYVAMQKEIRDGKTPLAKMVNGYIGEMRKTLTTGTDAKGNPAETVDSKFGKDWQTASKILNGDASKETVFIYQPPGVFKPNAGWIYAGGYTEGTLNPTTAPRGIRATIWDNSINNAWRKDGLASKNRDMAAMAYIFSDPDFWPGRYYDWGIGNPNFHTDMHNIPGMVAAQINTHPDAKKWAEYSKREISADVARSSWQPGGGWTESPGYTGHAYSVFLPTAQAFRRSGLTDPFADPNFRGALGYIENLLTPFDKRKGARGQMSIGDSGHDVRVENFQQAAMAYQKSDPAFAADLMAAAQSAIKDGEAIKLGTLGTTLSTTDPAMPANPAWKLESKYYGGVGAFLRSRFGKPDEGLVTFKAGPARNHYQGDELSFTFWGAGDYLAVDYSSFYNPRMNPDWAHNKVTFGLTASSPVADMMAFESTPDADLAVADNKNDSLQLMTPPYASARALWDYLPIHTSTKTDRRLMLFVKHPEGSTIADYLVIRDELTGQIRDTLDPAQLQKRIALVVEECLQAYVRDASFSPSQADELFAELTGYLKMLGADDATAAALAAAARKAAVPGRSTQVDLDRDAPELRKALTEALPKFHFSHEPRANIHLLALENPAKSKDRLDFKGQMGTDIAVFVATGQDASQADIKWFGWGHTKRPADFAKGPDGPKGTETLPWNGGPFHSYRHGFVLGRDVALATDSNSKLPTYSFGEMAQWISLPFQGKDEMTMVLYPVAKGKPAPQFEALDGGKSVKVSVGGQSETLTLATGQPVKISRDGKDVTIAASLPAVGSPQPAKLVPKRSIEGIVDKPDDNPNPERPAP